MKELVLVFSLIGLPAVGEYTTNEEGWSRVSEASALLTAYKITEFTKIYIDGEVVKAMPAKPLRSYRVYTFKVDNQGNFTVLLLITKKTMSKDFNLGGQK